MYVLHDSSPSCPSCCLHFSSWLCDDDAFRTHCTLRLGYHSDQRIVTGPVTIRWSDQTIYSMVWPKELGLTIWNADKFNVLYIFWYNQILSYYFTCHSIIITKLQMLHRISINIIKFVVETILTNCGFFH